MNLRLQLKEEKQRLQEMKRQLRDLVGTVSRCIAVLDHEMKKPSTPERGGRITQVANALEFARDVASYFGLGLPLKKAKQRTRTET